MIPRIGVQGAVSARTAVVRVVVVLALVALVACSKPPAAAPAATPAVSQENGLESIPAPDPSKYPKFEDMSSWKNPYFVVREDGIGLVDLENHEVHILTPEQIPAELASLGSHAWPYGRVALVTEAAPTNPTAEVKAQLRKNRALLAGTLKELEVTMREFP